jgi:alanine racemase
LQVDVANEHLRCWAEIDLDAIRHNAAVAGRIAGPDAGVMAIVKANAYGHGLREVVRALRNSVAMFGVANLREALAIREALDVNGGSAAGGKGDAPGIFILGPALPVERPEIVAGGFIPAISSLREAAAYSALGHGGVLVHLALDTGMGRIGIGEENACDVIHEIMRLPGLLIGGIATHLPVADEDVGYTEHQLERFEKVVTAIRELGVSVPLVHSLNSAGLFRFPQAAGSLVRAGLMLYGSSPLAEFQDQIQPALTLKTRITLIRELPAGHGVSYGRTFITPGPMRVATLAIGYADGWHRALSGRGAEVLIRGMRCPMLGRVTMDQIVVDVSHVADAVVGDEVILIGESGAERILAAEVATKAGTIAWEVFTSLGPRVDRLYFPAH